MRITTLMAAAILLLPSATLAQTASPRSIPYVKNIKVDGSISQWKDVPSIGNWNNPASIVYGKSNWKGPADLGGTGWMGWDEQNLYIAADITDDVVCQPFTGENLWHGDHVMVLLNVKPQTTTVATRFTQAGQFMFGLSPGSLKTGGDLLSNLPPEVYIWQPQYVSNSGISLTATRTANGYELQAAVPWSFLGVTPHDGMKIDFDICPSDCDTADQPQKALASLVRSKWEISTNHVVHGVLSGGPAAGAAAQAGPKIPLSKSEIKLSHGQSRDFTFQTPEKTDDLAPVLSLKARLVYKQLGGASHALTVLINGHKLLPERCINRPRSVTFASGQDLSLFQAGMWTLFYSPDYKAINTDEKSSYYFPITEADGYAFAFNVQGLLKSGSNTVTIRDDAGSSQKQDLAFEDVNIEWVSPEAAKKHEAVQKVRPPVTVRPHRDLAPPADAALDRGGAIRFDAAGRTWTIDSQFSEPNGKWLKLADNKDANWSKFQRPSSTELSAAAAQFTLDRQIKSVGQCLEIHEKLTNLTGDKLPIMIRHQLHLPVSQLAALTLNGRPMPLKRGITSDAENPTLLLKTTQGGGIALVPYDGVFRLHHQAFYLDNTAGLADSTLVLAPHASYEQVWQIYSVPSGDYWDLVNAIRKQWDNNFKLIGPFAFVDPRTERPQMQGAYDLAQMKHWLEVRNVGVPVISAYDPTSGAALQGLANTLDSTYLAKVNRLVDLIRQADPQLPVLRYYHCFITGTPYDKDADPADALITASGGQAFYSNDKHWPIYVPTDTNKYGRQMVKLAKDLVEKLHLNGLYWDEEQYSYQLYDYNPRLWDGVSGDIDRNSHKLLGTKSLVPLISAKLRYQIMDWMLDNHMTVVCNGQPMTPAEARFKVHRFVETASLSNMYDANLFSPCGLGDHLTERTHADVMRSQRRYLDYGCLYDYYNSEIDVKNPGLCRWMYPITPVALGPGYILGQEKILTNRSGKYSWGDKTLPALQVHVIDAMGNEVKADWQKVDADGIQWVQLKLPPDYAAAIVKQ